MITAAVSMWQKLGAIGPGQIVFAIEENQ